VPYLVQDALKAQGANFLAAADWAVHVIQDGPLVTGQNPQSSRQTARALLDALSSKGVS
jgi:putative intracellular protease/amidase